MSPDEERFVPSVPVRPGPSDRISRSYLIRFEIIVRNNQYSPNYRTHRTPGCHRDLGNNKNKMKLFGTLDTCMMGTNTLLFSGSSHRFEVPNRTVCVRALSTPTPPTEGQVFPLELLNTKKKKKTSLLAPPPSNCARSDILFYPGF